MVVYSESLISKFIVDHDGAEPSSNSVAAENLIRLAAILENEAYNDVADKLFHYFKDTLTNHPGSVPMLSSAYLLREREIRLIVMTGKKHSSEFNALQDVYRGKFVPNRAVQYLKRDGYLAKKSSIALNLPTIGDEKACAHICQNNTCGPPFSNPEDLKLSLFT